MPQLGSCAGCGNSLWQEANGEPRFCDACLANGTTAPAEEPVAEVEAPVEEPAEEPAAEPEEPEGKAKK